jgi:diguanylate cyclase (GGDEF)-like protein
MVTAAEHSRGPQPRLLFVEPDASMVSVMTRALQENWCDGGIAVCDEVGRRLGGCGMCDRNHFGGCSDVVVSSLHGLHGSDLTKVDLVICAVGLPDGSGLDALAYVRGMRPELPVILTGSPDDAAVAVEAIRAGAIDFLISNGREMRALPLAVEKCMAHQRIKHENERLQRDLSRSLAELEVKNQQLETVIRQLQTMARTDELTGLANRRWLNLTLEGSWAEATRHDLPLACLMLDLDGFKRLNDEMGHHRGDEILRLLGRVISANCRDVDVSARYGGDEFCVLMPHTQPQDALRVADRILREFRLVAARLPADEPRLSLSIGVSHIEISRPIRAEQLLMHADEALYGAKALGKNRIAVRETTGVREIAELPC